MAQIRSERSNGHRTTRPRKHKSILVIDDEVNVAKTLTMVLEQEGYTAAFAFTARSGIELACRIGPDIALVDVDLPDIDGIEAAVTICERVPNCKILLISGHPNSTSKLEQARARGINFEIVAKPIPPLELVEKLDALVR